MNTKYKLIGFLNMFNIVPDFVFPVFEYDGNIFFQEGEYDIIKKFGIAKPSVKTKIIPLVLSETSYNKGSIFLDVFSSPIYAFQTEKQNIIFGDSTHIRRFFETYIPQNDILASEISNFIETLHHPKNELILNTKDIYQPKFSTYYGTGRRKTSIARVYIHQGTGNITINNRNIDNYFGLCNLKYVVHQPLCITDNLHKFDVRCTVTGGGVTGQAGAISLGLSRALLQYDPGLRASLKTAGLLTRDDRMKERKKYGLKAARKAPQFSKR